MPDAPGRDRREPSRGSPNWVVRGPLARWLEEQGRQASGLRVLDVGCGVKPYEPFFAEAAAYVGVDVVETPYADLVGPAEALPVDDASYDLVLCIQVLEHVDDPRRAVEELWRVTRPGGRVLASTHGTQIYHPSPADHWRWTHSGLARLFESAAEWRSVTVTPGAGTGSTLAMLTSTYVALFFERLHLGLLGHAAVRAINALGGALDRTSPKLRDSVQGSLIANYHVTAER
jgi:SAM-dependent methyltransferase